MTLVAISIDTDEALAWAARCLGCRFVAWRARAFPAASVWEVELAAGAHLDVGTKITISSPDDDLWGGPIALECLEP